MKLDSLYCIECGMALDLFFTIETLHGRFILCKNFPSVRIIFDHPSQRVCNYTKRDWMYIHGSENAIDVTSTQEYIHIFLIINYKMHMRV